MEKRCPCCTRIFSPPETGFTRDRTKASGFCSFCRECKGAKKKAWAKALSPERKRIRNRKRVLGRSAGLKARLKANRRPKERLRRKLRIRLGLETPEQKMKRLSRNATKKAIKAGRLVRQPCEKCGFFPAEAHHDDYNKRFEVRWLCGPHHREHHGMVPKSGPTS